MVKRLSAVTHKSEVCVGALGKHVFGKRQNLKSDVTRSLWAKAGVSLYEFPVSRSAVPAGSPMRYTER